MLAASGNKPMCLKKRNIQVRVPLLKLDLNPNKLQYLFLDKPCEGVFGLWVKLKVISILVFQHN